MKILLIRHGETDSNKNRTLMGQRVDESLNEAGILQVKKLAEELKDSKIDLIFSSPLKRATETAKIVSERTSAEIILRDELKERDFGTLSGKNWDGFGKELGMSGAEARQKDFDQKYDYRAFDGESADDVHKRLLSLTAEIKKLHADKKVAIVAHGGILRAAEFLLNKKGVGHIDNAAAIEFTI